MVHVQHLQIGPGIDTVAHGNFRTVAEAVAATEARSYGPGHWQEITDPETGVRLVRADGRSKWDSYPLPSPHPSDQAGHATNGR